MTFIVAAASTAAVSALSAGAITGGVAGALGGIAAGTAGAGLAAAGGIAAGAATAGALGAGIGAAGAAITGGDVGKGALSGAVSGAVTGGIAPGLGGATSGLGAVGSGIVTGGIAGAAGSAAGAGAVGEDAGKAALMGGGLGAVGGALGGVGKGAPTAEQAAADAATATGGTKLGDPNSVSDMMATRGDIGKITNPNTGGVSTADLTPVSDLTKGSGGLDTFKTAPTLPENAAQGLTNVNSNSVYGGGKIADAIAVANPTMSDRLNLAGDAFKGGMSAVQADPMRAAKGLVAPLATGVMYGGGLDAAKPKPRTPVESIGGAPLADNFQAIQEPTRDILPKYYAEGGAIQPQPAQENKMNSFASMGMEAAQIGQQTVQQQQAQQPQPQVQQGIVPLAPIAQQPQLGMQQPQQQPKFYADGGAVTTTNGQGSFADQVRALAAQKVEAHYAQQAQQLATQPQMQQPVQAAANGGVMRDNLGGYSHGGIAGLTSAVGSGVSDDIPAQIGNSGKQPARLAANEFVIPARAVSELGQGSSEAGAKQLQAMVDRIQAGRKKSIGKGKIAVDSKATKNLPA